MSLGYGRDEDCFYYEPHTDQGSYLATKKTRELYWERGEKLIFNYYDERVVFIDSGYKLQIGTELFEFIK